LTFAIEELGDSDLQVTALELDGTLAAHWEPADIPGHSIATFAEQQ